MSGLIVPGAQPDGDPWMQAWRKLEAFIVAGATKDQITEPARELGRELSDVRNPEAYAHQADAVARRRTGDPEMKEETMDKTALYARDLDGVAWRKSSFSNDIEFECVEVADLGDGAVAVRDSTDPARAALRFTAAEWAAFTAGVRAGHF